MNADALRIGQGRTIPGTRYRVVDWLGEGGMGVVYEAEHINLGRRVAVKVLRTPEQLDPEVAGRFRFEARTASNLGSDYIADVFDFGELPDGRLMFAMELVDGTGMSELIQDGPLSLARAIPILRQICKGLAAAHAAGVVHCDIKPENVLLTCSEGRNDHVKLVDFGIAQIRSGDGHSTYSGTGTPMYMAPEQCMGLPFDARLDIYALGCTMYELLTGHPPFRARTIGELLEAQVSEQPRPPSLAVDASQPGREAIPAAIDRVVLRCLAKQPANRFANVHDLEAALCEVQIELGIETPWDDLPLPTVDPERLEMLIDQMPTPEPPTTRGRWRAPVLASTAALALFVSLAIALTPAADADADAIERTTTLVSAANKAASQAYYVYPPVADPDSATAYRVIRELEALEAERGLMNGLESDALRNEYAATLSRLGDRYWEDPNGHVFAPDYYAQASLFDPILEPARTRSGLLPGELSHMRDLAEHGGFTNDELEAARVLEILATDDPAKIQRQVALYDPVASGLSHTTTKQLYAVAGITHRQSTISTTQNEVYSQNAAAGPDTIGRSVSVALSDEEAGPRAQETNSAPGRARPNEIEPSTAATRDRTRSPSGPEASRGLAVRGHNALRAGRTRDASLLFEKALLANSRNGSALIGLSDIAFDSSKFRRAAVLARRAVRIEPKNASYRIRLGDAQYKLYRHEESRTQYETAKRLGHKDAAGRLETLRSKIGN